MRLLGGVRKQPADAMPLEVLSAQFTQSVLAALDQGVLVFSMAGEVEYWNPSAERILDRHFTVGCRLDDGFTLDQDGSPLPPDATPLARVLLSGRPVRHVLLGHSSAGGPVRWLKVSAEPIAAVDVLPPYVVVTFSEVTEQRRVQQDLDRYREELDALAKARGRRPGGQKQATVILPLPVWPGNGGEEGEPDHLQDRDSVLSQQASTGTPLSETQPSLKSDTVEAWNGSPAGDKADVDSQQALPNIRGHDRSLAIGRLKYDRQLYLRSLRLFEAELLRIDGELARLQRVGEAERIGRDLRRLKGSAGLLAAQAVVALVGELELAIAAFLHARPMVGDPARDADTPLPEPLSELILAGRAALSQHRAGLLEDLGAIPGAVSPAREEITNAQVSFLNRENREEISSQNNSGNHAIFSLIAALESHDLSALDAFRALEIPLRRILTHRQERELRMAMEVLAFERAAILLREQVQVAGAATP